MTLIGIIAGDKSAALKSLSCALCYAFFCQAEVFRVFVEILSGGLTYIRGAHLLMRRIAENLCRVYRADFLRHSADAL